MAAMPVCNRFPIDLLQVVIAPMRGGAYCRHSYNVARPHAMDTLELATPTASLRIAPTIGGALTAFTVGGVPILRDSSDTALRDVLSTACYPLVPYSNRIADATLRFAGRTWRLARNFGDSPHAIHGVGWQRAWRVVEVSAAHARLALDHDPGCDGAAAWPWRFRAMLSYRLHERDGHVLSTCTLGLRNTGSDMFPFGLGFHPFFPRHATTTLGFTADAVWRNDASQLPREKMAIPGAWRFAAPRPLDGVTLDNVFSGFRGDATIDDDRAMRRIEADRALAFVVVYVPADGGAFAVEPVTHETDAFNRAAAGADATGMRMLAPGDAFSCTMRVAARARTDR
jgi:aldose 1-epimerase